MGQLTKKTKIPNFPPCVLCHRCVPTVAYSVCRNFLDTFPRASYFENSGSLEGLGEIFEKLGKSDVDLVFIWGYISVRSGRGGCLLCGFFVLPRSLPKYP